MNFATASGGTRTRTVNGSGTGSDVDAGTLVTAPVLFNDPG